MLESFYPSTLWVDKFKVCSPIVLDTLEIRISSLQPLSFDIQMLTTLTRVNMISTHLLDHSIIIHPQHTGTEAGLTPLPVSKSH
jgi:hypothetical protein